MKRCDMHTASVAKNLRNKNLHSLFKQSATIENTLDRSHFSPIRENEDMLVLNQESYVRNLSKHLPEVRKAADQSIPHRPAG